MSYVITRHFDRPGSPPGPCHGKSMILGAFEPVVEVKAERRVHP